MWMRAAAVSGALVVIVVATLQAAALSRQQADSLARKIELIVERGAAERPAGQPLRTTVSEGELNSWLTYHAPPLLPEGVTRPRLTIVDSRRVIGAATVDLDVIARSRQSGRTFDIWNLIGGRMPITVSGSLVARGGRGRFELQSAEVNGIPVPTRIVQELVDYYTRTPDRPQGLRLDEELALPAGIVGIELRPGVATVVQ